MKNIFFIIFFFLFLSICFLGIGQKVDSASIIGKPIIINNLVIAQHDFPFKLNQDVAKAACAKLGPGWRLPTKDELNILYKNRYKIGGFKSKKFSGYWSSSVYYLLSYWLQFFENGFQNTNGESAIYFIRAVRDKFYDVTQVSTWPKDKVIGLSKKIGNLEIAQYDFPNKMTWEDAKFACANLGSGWRLPTDDEIEILYQNKVEIAANPNSDYWSSGQISFNKKSVMQFSDGRLLSYTHIFYKYSVRAVKTITSQNSSINIFDLIQGKWQNLNDKTNYLIFDNNNRKEIGSGMQTWNVESFILSKKCLNENDEKNNVRSKEDRYISCKDSDLCWYIEEVDKNFLTLIFVGRGNTLKYKRIN